MRPGVPLALHQQDQWGVEVKKTYTYTTAEGNVETRTNGRRYTHIVVGRRDYNKERAAVVAQRAAMAKRDRATYRYWQTCATTKVGDMHPKADYPVRQDMHDQGIEIIAKYPTVNAYVASNDAARYAAIPAGDLGPEAVLQWCTSERAARKAIEAHSRFHSDVRVVALP
jgi:hypothetical protein